MTITLNGLRHDVDAGATVQSVAPRSAGVAVALNGAVVPSTAWSTTRLVDGDVVEIVTAHQGG